LTTIKFPEQSYDSVDVYHNVLSSYKKTVCIDGTVTVDLSEVKFIKPVGLNLTCCMIASLLLRGRAVSFKRPLSMSVEKYLTDEGFYKTFDIQDQSVRANPRETSVQLRQIAQKIDYGYINQIPYWLNQNSQLDPNVIREVVQINLVEAIKNVLDHSKSSFGCYVCAQAYHRQSLLVFCVMDFGVGFRANLQPVYPEIQDDVVALTRAVESGVSSLRKIDQRPRGAGLDVIRGFMKRMGTLEIVSGAGRWVSDPKGRVQTDRLPVSFPGSYLLLNLEIQRLKDYSEELAEDNIDF